MTRYSSPPKLAALPWYNFPSTRPHLDTVWRETRSRLGAAGIGQTPVALNHSIDYAEFHADPQLTLSQCCGLDLFQPHTRNVIPFAAPVITAYEVPRGRYFSRIVARPSARLDAPHVVINNRFSHSGHTAIRMWLKLQGIARFTVSETGSHAQSLASLREGRADLAAIDALSWLHLDTAGLEILDTSEPAPAPPFITGRESDVSVKAMTAALNAAFQRFGGQIGIGGVLPVAKGEYQEMADTAATLGVAR